MVVTRLTPPFGLKGRAFLLQGGGSMDVDYPYLVKPQLFRRERKLEHDKDQDVEW